MTLYFPFQEASERRHDRLRCTLCRRWTRTWVTQGLIGGADPDSTSRRLCPSCAERLRGERQA